MKTIYLMTRLAWKVFISSKPCRLIVILLQGFVQHMFDKLLFLLTPLKIAISYKVKKNSTKWNSRAGARLRQQTFSLGAKCASPGGLLYDREVRRTFLSYEKAGEQKPSCSKMQVSLLVVSHVLPIAIQNRIWIFTDFQLSTT